MSSLWLSIPFVGDEVWGPYTLIINLFINLYTHILAASRGFTRYPTGTIKISRVLSSIYVHLGYYKLSSRMNDVPGVPTHRCEERSSCGSPKLGSDWWTSAAGPWESAGVREPRRIALRGNTPGFLMGTPPLKRRFPYNYFALCGDGGIHKGFSVGQKKKVLQANCILNTIKSIQPFMHDWANIHTYKPCHWYILSYN